MTKLSFGLNVKLCQFLEDRMNMSILVYEVVLAIDPNLTLVIMGVVWLHVYCWFSDKKGYTKNHWS